MKQLLLIGCLALVATACAGADDGSLDAEPHKKAENATEKAPAPENTDAVTVPAELNAETAMLWLPSGTNGYTSIPVCWETADHYGFKELVRQAIADSWEKAARVEFTGWQDCSGPSDGIRISVQDVRAHTKGIGRSLAGAAEGMVLNFTFLEFDGFDDAGNPVDVCKLDANKEFCIEAIAVHEFGHALGFPHEQDRPDVPTEECKAERQYGVESGDAQLGVFDWESVMNYCNERWTNGGELSNGDREQVANVYGGVNLIDDPDFACFIPPCPTVPTSADGGNGLLHYGDVVAIGDATGNYLRMDGDEDIRSDVPHFQAQERWVLVNPDAPSDTGALMYDGRVALQGHTGAFMTARDDLSIRSWGQIGGEWEVWTIVRPDGPTGDYVDVVDPIVLHSGVVDGYMYHDFGNPRLTHNIGYGEVWYMRGPF